jgi:predicted adenine nucleotide alpha hydrolase (AANH) superfamily ATPase
VAAFHSADAAYQFIEKYLDDTKVLHVYFARSTICPKGEYEDYIENEKCVAVNIVLGQFEDMLYVRKVVE